LKKGAKAPFFVPVASVIIGQAATSGADYGISTWKTEAGIDARLGDTSSGALVAGAAL